MFLVVPRIFFCFIEEEGLGKIPTRGGQLSVQAKGKLLYTQLSKMKEESIDENINQMSLCFSV